jgi:hypothetical protein
MATTSAIIRINLEVDGGQKLALSVTNLKELKAAIKQINDTKISLDPRSPQFAAASNQLKTLQGLYKGLAKDADSAETQIEQANAALNEPPKAIGYYRQLQAQLVALTNQYKDLSQSEQNSRLGQNLSKQIGGISATLKAQDAQLGNFQRNVGNYKQGLLSIADIATGGLITGGIIGITGAIIGLGAASIQASDEQAKADAQISSAIKSTAGAAGKSLYDLKRQADELQNVTLFSDDQTQGAQALLLTFTSIRGEIFDKTIPIIQDLSTAFNQDLQSSAVQVGKALQDPIKGVASLGKVGVQFSADQKKLIQSLVETGDVAGAQTIILKELETQVGGSARAAAQAGLGPFQLLKQQFGEILETVGGGLVSAINQTVTLFTDLDDSSSGAAKSNDILSDSFVELSSEIEQSTVATETNFNILRDGRSTQEQRKQAIDELVTLYPSLLTQQQLEAANIEQLNGLQALSTQVLRAQITERIKLRSKEQITTELVQKKLRQVQLEATPDRALLGELTSGETLRNFGILDPIKLRARLKQQFDGDIKEFENALENVDAQFSRLAKSDEDNLSPAQQDALDKFRQFNEGAAAATDKDTEATNNNTESKAKNKAENLGAADSIARLTKNVNELQDALSKAPQSGIVSATQKLVLAEQALARAKAKEQEARNPTQNLTEFQQAEAGLVSLGVDVNTPPNEADAKAQLDALALALSGQAGVTIPVEVDQDQARKDFELQKYFLDQEDKSRAENAEKDKQRKEEQQRQNQEFLDIGLQAASQFNSQLAAQENARVDANLQKQTDAINAEFDEKRAAAQGNAVIIANLDKQQQAAQLAAEKEAARQRKNIALKEAVIAYALAAIKAGPNVAGQIAAAAAFALGLAAINAQEFFAGGVAKDVTNQEGVVKSANMKPTKHGDNRVAFLKVGERVLTKDNQAAIEQQYGSGIWRNIGAKDPGSIFGARHGSMVNPSYGFGRPILNVSTSLSREDIGLLARANAITSERIAESVKVGLAEGAKYNARQEKALSKTR